MAISYTSTDIDVMVANAGSCAVDLAYDISKVMSEGRKTCECKWQQLKYVIRSQKILLALSFPIEGCLTGDQITAINENLQQICGCYCNTNTLDYQS